MSHLIGGVDTLQIVEIVDFNDVLGVAPPHMDLVVFRATLDGDVVPEDLLRVISLEDAGDIVREPAPVGGHPKRQTHHLPAGRLLPLR